MSETLPHRHLTTMMLDVDFGGIVPIGAVANGSRGIAPVRGGRCEGERLSADVLPGADWFIGRPDGIDIDVRLTLKTDDGALIYLAYTGGMRAAPEAMAHFRAGEMLGLADYRLTTVARFECGVERYRWLNEALVVGVGEQTASGPIYRLFEVGA